MSKTSIEWTEMSWNPLTGCTKISPGCKNCYAERMARRQVAMGLARHERGSDNDDTWIAYSNAIASTGRWSGEITCRHKELDAPLHWKKPRTIFVCSMSDLFHASVQDKWLWRIFKVMAATNRHIFQVLTKRPRVMFKFCQKWRQGFQHGYDLSNVWLGVSVESPDYLWRIEELLRCSAAVRFVSLEPLLEPIYFNPHLLTSLDWVIVGGESGPGARPMHPDWVRGIRDQCVAADVPFFFKQWGSAKPDVLEARRWLDAGWNPDGYTHGRLLDGRTWDEMPIL